MDHDFLFDLAFFATNLIVYPNAMNDISPDIIDSAKVDGVDNMFTDLRTIILPLIWPTLTTFLVTGVASILSNSGPILEFYYLSAPPYVQNMGYYYTVQVLKPGVRWWLIRVSGRWLADDVIDRPFDHSRPLSVGAFRPFDRCWRFEPLPSL
jgi:hypothetical protein